MIDLNNTKVAPLQAGVPASPDGRSSGENGSAYCNRRPTPSRLGAVPMSWELKRLKYCVSLVNDKLDSVTPDLPYVGLENIESATGRLALAGASGTPAGTALLFRPGDVLFGKLRPYLAKALHADFAGQCSTELLVLRPKQHLGRYLWYLALSRGFVDIVDSSTYGAKMPRASWDFIGNLVVPVPTRDEQRAIASFLDHETSRIDRLISGIASDANCRGALGQMSARLNEYRAALIGAAVTGRLDVDDHPPEAPCA